MKNRLFLVVVFMFFFTGTNTLYAQNSTNSSPKINELITKKRDYNKKNGFGYRIQLYYGNEVKAKSTISKFKYMFPGVYAKLVYDNPEWKAHVGNYKTKLEADKDLLLFKENFSGIIVIPMGK